MQEGQIETHLFLKKYFLQEFLSLNHLEVCLESWLSIPERSFTMSRNSMESSIVY